MWSPFSKIEPDVIVKNLEMISEAEGARVEADLGTLMFKRLRVFGTMLRVRTVEEKAAATAGFTRDVVPLLESGVVSPVIARTLPLDDAREAYDLLAADAVFGGLVLDLT